MLFVNQNKLYSESIFGKGLESLFKEESSKLAVQNKKLTKKLQLEEQILTEKRDITPLKDFKFLINKSIAFVTLFLLSKKISLHIISFEAAILEKSLKPPALYLMRPNLSIFSKSWADLTKL